MYRERQGYLTEYSNLVCMKRRRSQCHHLVFQNINNSRPNGCDFIRRLFTKEGSEIKYKFIGGNDALLMAKHLQVLGHGHSFTLIFLISLSVMGTCVMNC